MEFLKNEEIEAVQNLAIEKARKLVETMNSSVFIAYASSEDKFNVTAEIAFYERVAHKMKAILNQK